MQALQLPLRISLVSPGSNTPPSEQNEKAEQDRQVADLGIERGLLQRRRDRAVEKSRLIKGELRLHPA